MSGTAKGTAAGTSLDQPGKTVRDVRDKRRPLRPWPNQGKQNRQVDDTDQECAEIFSHYNPVKLLAVATGQDW